MKREKLCAIPNSDNVSSFETNLLRIRRRKMRLEDSKICRGKHFGERVNAAIKPLELKQDQLHHIGIKGFQTSRTFDNMFFNNSLKSLVSQVIKVMHIIADPSGGQWDW